MSAPKVGTLAFDDIFIGPLTSSYPADQVIDWMKATVNNGLGKFQRNFLHDPDRYRALYRFLGGSSALWKTTAPSVIDVCSGRVDPSRARSPILHDLAQLTAAIALNTRIVLQPPRGYKNPRNFKYDLAYNLILTAVLEQQNNPGGEFQGWFHAKDVEKLGKKSVKEGNFEKEKINEGERNGTKRGPTAVSGEADGLKFKNMRQDSPENSGVLTPGDTLEQSPSLQAQLNRMVERLDYLEMEVRHKTVAIEELEKANKAQKEMNEQLADKAPSNDAQIKTLKAMVGKGSEQLQVLEHRANHKSHQVTAITDRLDKHEARLKKGESDMAGQKVIQDNLKAHMTGLSGGIVARITKDSTSISELRKENQKLAVEVGKIRGRQEANPTIDDIVAKVVDQLKKMMEGGELTSTTSLNEAAVQEVVKMAVAKMREQA